MQNFSASKYGFRIRTKGGVVVDNLSIFGKDAPDAERKLRQIYLGCEILEARRLFMRSPKSAVVSFEDVIDLISEHAPGESGDDGRAAASVGGLK